MQLMRWQTHHDYKTRLRIQQQVLFVAINRATPCDFPQDVVILILIL